MRDIQSETGAQLKQTISGLCELIEQVTGRFAESDQNGKHEVYVNYHDKLGQVVESAQSSDIDGIEPLITACQLVDEHVDALLAGDQTSSEGMELALFQFPYVLSDMADSNWQQSLGVTEFLSSNKFCISDGDVLGANGFDASKNDTDAERGIESDCESTDIDIDSDAIEEDELLDLSEVDLTNGMDAGLDLFEEGDDDPVEDDVLYSGDNVDLFETEDMNDCEPVTDESEEEIAPPVEENTEDGLDLFEDEESPDGSSDELNLFLGDDAEPEISSEASSLEEEAPSTTSDGMDGMQKEVIALISGELNDIVSSTDETLQALQSEDSGSRVDTLELLADQVGRVANATEMVGLSGLGRVSEFISINLSQIDVSTQPLAESFHSLIIEWPLRMQRYLEDGFDETAAALLAKLLSHKSWPQAMQENESEALLLLLINAEIQIDTSGVEPRQTEALPEDMSLAIPDDVDPSLLESLLDELPEQTVQFSASVQSMIKNRLLEDLELARRIAHTIKGSCNTVGIVGMANMTHQLEDILDQLALHSAVPVGKLANTFLDAADCLESMLESITSDVAPPGDALQVQQSILDWANHIDQQSLDGLVQSAVESSDDFDREDTNPEPELTTAETDSASDETTLRIRSGLVDELLRLAGENIISTGQVKAQLGKAQDTVVKLNTHNQYLTSLVNELEQLVDVRGVTSKQQINSDGELDDLEMERYNELHTSTHRLIEAAVDGLEISNNILRDLKSLEDVTVDQSKLVHENQEAVLKTRMVAVNTVIPRLQRCVRQAMRATDKQVRLEVTGADTLIDSNVLNDLMEPLMHLLRNAVDHGIEEESERQQANKPLEGCIQLIVAREGDHISVRIHDDGRGLNKDVIYAKAQERGLVIEDQVLSDDDIHNLILTPGFSTRSEVTQTSGRGVGMDVVSEKVRSMKGTLAIQSDDGQGSKFNISLPVTLLSAHVMLLPVGEQLFAVSNFGVDDILYAREEDMEYVGDKRVIKDTQGDIYETHFLNEKLGIALDRDQTQRSYAGLLVRDPAGKKSVVLSDRIIDSLDLVVKPLQQYVPDMAGVVGATILGDGSVAPVLDLTELLDASVKQVIRNKAEGDQSPYEKSQLPKALVVDDSHSARTTLEQLVIDLGFEVRVAKDGMEAVNMIDEDAPDIVLTDLEMPRMNGLDLSTHVRNNEKTKDIPIILITSRTTQKHRDLANAAGVSEYMTKPYSEDALTQNIEVLLAS